VKNFNFRAFLASFYRFLPKASLASLTNYLRGVTVFSTAGMLLFSLILDFSSWLPFPSMVLAMLLQAGVLVKLAFEERYLQLKFRRLSWKKKLIPIALFAISLLFYVEKGLILHAIWEGSPGPMAKPYQSYSVIFFSASLLIYVLRLNVVASLFSRLSLKPAQTLLMGFVALILLGTLLLSLPQMVIDPTKISIIDALFTATSASTVTGLVLMPISEFYQPSGLWVILVLIQLGGLGIMTFGVLFALISHKRIKLHDEVALQGVLETESVGTVRKEIRLIFIMTFGIETVGALLMWVFLPEGSSFFTAVFHSISAFCNAGFSLIPNNLEGYTGHIPINFIIVLLIILGGVGFPVLNNLGSYPITNKGRVAWRLSFHSKMVLSISASLLFIGTIGIYLLEYNNALAELSWFDKWLAAFFHSVTARTAGFNTLDLGSFSSSSLFLLMLLMWIGGSPASTAGGIKTTTFGVMFATLRAMLRHREEVSLFERSLSPLAVKKSISIAFSSSALLAILLLLLLSTEEGSFKALMFESISAFNTVGLSTGITASLSPVGKIIIILTMFIGRIGPLTLAFSLAERVSKGKYTYPRERVIIG